MQAIWSAVSAYWTLPRRRQYKGLARSHACSLWSSVADLRHEDLSPNSIAALKTLLLDQIACELIGSPLPCVEPAIALARLTRGATEESTLVNHGDRLLAAEAAFVNATF